MGLLAKNVDFDSNQLNKFKDGYFCLFGWIITKIRIVLSKIVEKLEKKRVPGIILKPSTQRECMHNIQKCMEMLTKSKKIGTRCEGLEEQVALGNSGAIKELLQIIKEAYGVRI